MELAPQFPEHPKAVPVPGLLEIVGRREDVEESQFRCGIGIPISNPTEVYCVD